ncbi:MAG: Gfo/Idh/MocA family oxidoreductase [Clostridia bacterium]|nr:Gfo/Idh/MocA family oxidoreductase [Clostridia bacterium]
MNPVRIGIIGFGNQGSAYVRLIHKEKKVPHAVIGAVCDTNEQKLAAQCEKWELDCPRFTTHAALLDSGTVDAVIVTTPHYFHPQIMMDALNHGLHALSDKPAGVYTKQVKDMLAVAKQHPALVFAIMFNQRTNAAYRKMREMIAAGELGDVKRVNWIITDWYRSQSYYDSGAWRATWRGEGGGVLFNQAPHQLDLLPWVVGMLPCKMQAHCHFGKWHDIETEDDVTAYMEFPNGATGVFVTSTADFPGTNRFEVLGTKGKLVCENGAKLTFYESAVDEREFNRTYKGGFGTPQMTETVLFEHAPARQHEEILNNFADAILGLEPLKVSGFDGINGVEMMDAMLLSQWLGKAVALPIDDELYFSELQKRIETGRPLKSESGAVLDTKGTY